MIAIKPNGEVWMDKHPVDIRAIRANIVRLQNEQSLGSAVIALIAPPRRMCWWP